MAMVVAACGGGGKTASDVTVPPASARPAEADLTTTASPRSAPTSDAPARPPLVVDGEFDEQALSGLVDDTGDVDTTRLAELIEEFSELPEEQQLALIEALSVRTEIEAAAVSGLAAELGDGAGAEAALRAAWAPVGASVAAIDPDALTAELGAPSTSAPAGPVSGFRRAAPDAPSTAGSVAAVGLMLGLMGLSGIADPVVQGANTLTPDQYREESNNGTTISGALEQSAVELEFHGKQDGVDVDFEANAVFHPCPKPDGTFDIESMIDTKTSKNGHGQNATIEVTITGQVDDDANLASKHVESRTQWADFGGGTGQFLDFTFSGSSGFESFRLNRSGGSVTQEFASLATFLSVVFVAMIVDKYVDAAVKAFQSGRCVSLVPTASPGPKGLKPGDTSTITAAPRSKIDGAPTGGDVTAVLTAGGQSVEPSGSKVPADATFRYLAPGETGQQATVAFESRSKRGVGKATIDFDTKATKYSASGGGSEIAFSGTVDSITAPFTIDAQFIGGNAEFNFDPGSEGGLVGTVSIAGGGGGATVTGGGTYSIAEHEDGTATLTMSTEACVDVSGVCRQSDETITLTPIA
jgi:hypothetical protein